MWRWVQLVGWYQRIPKYPSQQIFFKAIDVYFLGLYPSSPPLPRGPSVCQVASWDDVATFAIQDQHAFSQSWESGTRSCQPGVVAWLRTVQFEFVTATLICRFNFSTKKTILLYFISMFFTKLGWLGQLLAWLLYLLLCIGGCRHCAKHVDLATAWLYLQSKLMDPNIQIMEILYDRFKS